MRTILKGTLATLVVVGLLASLPSRAFALTRKFHPSACQVVPGSAGTLGFFGASGQATNTGAGELTLWCPLINDGSSVFGHTVTLHGFNLGCSGGPGVKAKVCFSKTSGGNTTCGSVTTTCSAGLVFSTPVNTPNTNPDDYPFLEVVIQPGAGGGFNTFFGYSMTGQ